MSLKYANIATAWLSLVGDALAQVGLLDQKIEHRRLCDLPRDPRVAPDLRDNLCTGTYGSSVVNPDRMGWAISFVFTRHAENAADGRVIRTGGYRVVQFIAKRPSKSSMYDAKVYIFTRTGEATRSTAPTQHPVQSEPQPVQARLPAQDIDQAVLEGDGVLTWTIRGAVMTFDTISRWN
jgi:hypothetical protein